MSAHSTASQRTDIALSAGTPSPAPRGPGRPSVSTTSLFPPLTRCSRAISREDRALCRVVPARYDVPPWALSKYLKVGRSTIAKAIGNSYTNYPDDTLEDNKILTSSPRYAVAIKELLDLKNHNASQGPERVRDGKTPRSTAAHPYPGSARRVRHKETQESTAAHPHSSVSAAPSGVIGAACDFVARVVAGAGLDEEWGTKLKSEHFNERKLKAMSKLPSSELVDIVTGLYPDAFNLDRRLLVAAIKALDVAETSAFEAGN
ncbi:hypothetical protein C8R47DRAFT_1109115 [Mycena vitilis]|nr:hypothetical protein C8R47DRAFT_1109115 [Mycena vitilis]